MMGPVTLARVAKDHLRDGESITLPTGILAMHPMPGSASISMVNAGLEAPPRLRCRETYASTSICVEAEPSISRSAVSRLAAAARALVFGQLPQCSAVINQGLFYLDWLMDHRKDFQWLVLEQLGKEEAEAVDWSAPRLICIAGDFNRYDDHRVRSHLGGGARWPQEPEHALSHAWLAAA